MVLELSNSSSAAASQATADAGVLSYEFEDPAWDDFLDSIPLGHFQQSSTWSRVKQPEGWKPIRFTVKDRGRIIGGFQILSRKSKLGSIGYVTKGPVVHPETPENCRRIISKLFEVVRERRLLALIVQPPDGSSILSDYVKEAPFSRNSFVRVVQTTLCNDLTQGSEKIISGLSESTRKNTRRAARRGVTVREGKREDLPRFFELMRQTCERQKTQPNPADLPSLQALWDALAPSRRLRITVAEAEGRIIAVLLSIVFGGALTLWKKGSDATEHHRHPNEALILEALEWGANHGLRYADFAALRRDIAESVLRGEALTEEQMRARDNFNLGFGGAPRYLPEATVYIANPLLRRIYDLASSNSVGQRLIKRLAS
jgi:peptidoglycan pentaglycine glycine transferase (the first glycine)